MSEQHTPGPWMTYPREFEHYEYGVRATPGTICVMPGWKMHADLAEQQKKNLLLIAAAPDLLEAQTMGVEVSTPDFLDWIASRLVNHYGESPNVDFVLSLRDRASAGRAAIAKATGETP